MVNDDNTISPLPSDQFAYDDFWEVDPYNRDANEIVLK